MEPKIRYALISDLSDLERIVLSSGDEINNLLLSDYDSNSIHFIASQTLSKQEFNQLYTIEINSEVIGFVNFYAYNRKEISIFLGYVLAKQYRGHGLMHSVCYSLINEYFEKYNLKSIKTLIESHNIASERFVQKLNFKHSGKIKAEYTKLCPKYDICLYVLNQSDFTNLKNRNYGTR